MRAGVRKTRARKQYNLKRLTISPEEGIIKVMIRGFLIGENVTANILSKFPNFNTRGNMATIFDIAQRAGVSPMTVSRAFNNPEKVKPETRSAIMNVAEELNFHPNNVARSLALKRTNIVFVYIPKGLSATEQFVAQSVTAIGERLGEHGYSFLLSRKLPSGESFDGMIMMGVSNDEEKNILAVKGLGKPVVLYGNSSDFEAWVDVDNYAGEKAAVDYLLKRGRTKIAAVCAPQNMHYAEERLNAYKDCLAEHGIAVSEDMIAFGDAAESGGYECTKRLLENVRPDAVVCATDTMALGCLRALREAGLSVPTDVAVVGFDGFGHENVGSPRLTTVRQPLFEVGVKLADVLISYIEGEGPQKIKILPSLLEGESA